MLNILWNTENSSTDESEHDLFSTDKSMEGAWGKYHKENSDTWIFSLLKKLKFKEIKNIDEIKKGNSLLIIDSKVHKKNKFYKNLKSICEKIFLVHLGDENGILDLSPIYENFNHVWRTFCYNKYFSQKNITCIPVGYKSNVEYVSDSKTKRYKWSFIGTPHASSRHDLLYHLSKITPNHVHKTDQFAGSNSLSSKEMSKILSQTVFLPCPNGVRHPESYRLYEALQCKCIPIVEDAYNYYERLYPNNPFIKINKWVEAKNIILDWNDEKVKKKSSEVENWWTSRISLLQDDFLKKINNG